MNQHYNFASCFASGIDDPSGLRLCFSDNGESQVLRRFVINPQYAGYPGMARGGIVAAISDEVAGRTVMVGNPKRFFVTARMDARFRQPVPVSVPLEATGWLLKRRASRTLAHSKISGAGQGILA